MGTVRLTLDSAQEVLGKDEDDVEITDLEEEPGSGRGDNYTSILYRVSVKGLKTLKTGEKVPWERAIIYKALPQSREHREAFKSEALFKNEVVFYTKVWPALDELQSDGKRVFGGVAKVYIAREDIIAMEDLRERGFKMADRTQGLQVESLKQVLKALAGFHALSLTLHDLRPEQFERLTTGDDGEGVKEALFREENEDWYRQYYRVAANNAIAMVSKTLSVKMEHRREEIMGKLRAFLHEDVFFRTMSQLAASKGPLTVFCHGDCWTNNILFKDESTDEAEPVYLVDFQLTRVGSLALDLVNLLYCCTSGDVRRVHMTQLLRHYHCHLMLSLQTLNPNTTRNASIMWEYLTQEMRRCGRFGVGLALDVLPISTCASDEAPDLYEDAEVDKEEGHAKWAPPLGGAKCAKLMTDLVIELIHNDAL